MSARGAIFLPNGNVVRDQAARCPKWGHFPRCEKKSGWAFLLIFPVPQLNLPLQKIRQFPTGLIKATLVPVQVLKTKKMPSSGQQRLVIFPKGL